MEKYTVASKILIVQQNPKGELIGPDNTVLKIPSDWSFLAAGDAGVTRKVTAQGEYWRVEYRKGRRTFSSGIWAPAIAILQAQQEVEQVRATEQYRKNKIMQPTDAKSYRQPTKPNFAKQWKIFWHFTQCTKNWRKSWRKPLLHMPYRLEAEP